MRAQDRNRRAADAQQIGSGAESWPTSTGSQPPACGHSCVAATATGRLGHLTKSILQEPNIPRGIRPNVPRLQGPAMVLSLVGDGVGKNSFVTACDIRDLRLNVDLGVLSCTG